MSDGWTHEFSLPVHAPAARIFTALTVQQALERWFAEQAQVEPHTMGQGQVLRPDFANPSPEIRLSMTVDAPPAAVFRTLTDPDALREWMGAPAPVVELRAGGRDELG